MKRLRLMLLLLVLGQAAMAQGDAQESVGAVLDRLHQAAASADWDAYFDLMSDDAVFLGTDAGERWTKVEFEGYARPTDGWVYTPQARNIDISPDGNSAWFDEILISRNYGTSRGTGVLLRTPDGWKIAQYHLTFPIPNALVDDITDSIKAFEGQ